ncbi:hypothetical protein BC938DRAFT_473544 [Jimgerdemannia flammicorona]|uniref:Uncharacterized protein n=1 Tax=Jimgerdemannia flammicorona TaxID=994334 RepID=A0A433Q3S2_9FUNG|nr:hypothetical protein BC938DRAFT_473544 [Jimgerdemannia flammicorona]
MEQRVQQFHDDTKGLATLAPAKDYRFSDKEKNKLFACIEAYFTALDRGSTASPDTTASPLIEDALKVPCFTTRQKMHMLKWYDEILAKQAGSAGSTKVESSSGAREEEVDDYADFDWDAFEKEGAEPEPEPKEGGHA